MVGDYNVENDAKQHLRTVVTYCVIQLLLNSNLSYDESRDAFGVLKDTSAVCMITEETFCLRIKSVTFP